MGETYKTFYSEGFPRDYMGFITGTSAFSKLPNAPGSLFRLKSQSTNIGSFFLGTSSGTISFELDAGDDTGWFKIANDNLNSYFYYNSSGSSERLSYWIQH